MKRLTRIGAGVTLVMAGGAVGIGTLVTGLIGTLYAVAHHWGTACFYALLTGVLGTVAVSLMYAGVKQAITDDEDTREQLKDISSREPRAYPGVDTNDC